MTPLLGTTGGGSGRGFGRGFKSAAAPAGPSAAPSNLSATPAYAGSSTTAQMSLSWTNGDATATTEIYNNTTSTLVTTVSAGTTSYTVTGLNSSTGYSFKVRHLKNSQYSSYTSNASNTTYDYDGHYLASVSGATAGYTEPLDYYSYWDQYANGSGGNYYNLNDRLSTSAGVTYTYTSTGGVNNSTPPGGTTEVMTFAIAAGGNAGPYGEGGGGSGVARSRVAYSSGYFAMSNQTGTGQSSQIYKANSSPSGVANAACGYDGTYQAAGQGGGAETAYGGNINGTNNADVSTAAIEVYSDSTSGVWYGGGGFSAYISGIDRGGYSRGFPYGRGESSTSVRTSCLIAYVANPAI
jgi:hypothetical protein